MGIKGLVASSPSCRLCWLRRPAGGRGDGACEELLGTVSRIELPKQQITYTGRAHHEAPGSSIMQPEGLGCMSRLKTPRIHARTCNMFSGARNVFIN